MSLPRVASCLPLLALSFFALPGCGAPSQTSEVKNTELEQFQRIGRAYIQAITKLKRGPNNLEELKPFLLQQPEGDTLVAAINDKTVVIIWGLDFKDLSLRTSTGGQPQRPVLAYGTAKVAGKRYVLLMGKQIEEMTDEQFGQAYFPKGHRPEL